MRKPIIAGNGTLNKTAFRSLSFLLKQLSQVFFQQKKVDPVIGAQTLFYTN